MTKLTEGSLAASLMYEGVCDVDEHSGFNRCRTVYLPHMAPRAAAVDRLTKAARELHNAQLELTASSAANTPSLVRVSAVQRAQAAEAEHLAALEILEQWKEPTL